MQIHLQASILPLQILIVQLAVGGDPALLQRMQGRSEGCTSAELQLPLELVLVHGRMSQPLRRRPAQPHSAACHWLTDQALCVHIARACCEA